MCMQCLWRPEEGTGSPWDWSYRQFWAITWCWGWNSYPSEGQCVFLSIKPPLQRHSNFFKICFGLLELDLTISLCSLGWYWTHYVLASASSVLELQMSAVMLSLKMISINWFVAIRTHAMFTQSINEYNFDYLSSTSIQSTGSWSYGSFHNFAGIYAKHLCDG